MGGAIIFWVIAFVALCLIEIASMQLVSIWFAAGSLIALLLAAFDCPIWIQVIGFIVTSIVLLIFTRPILKKLFVKAPVPTNADMDVGKSALVIEQIDNEKLTGRVKLSGVDWIARSADNTIIDKGTTVIVEKIDGSKLFVQKEDVS